MRYAITNRTVTLKLIKEKKLLRSDRLAKGES